MTDIITDVVVNVEEDSIVGVSVSGISQVVMQAYNGSSTETAQVIVNNETKIISANVKKLPNSLKIKKNGTQIAEFDGSSNIDANVLVPTKTSDLTNDSEFINKEVNNLTNYYDKGNNDYLLALKVDKVVGKELSTNDFTNNYKNKLDGIEENANNYVLPNDVVQDSSYVHTNNNYTTEEKTKLANIENNAQVNDIEVVKVNNVALPIVDKLVNVEVPIIVDTLESTSTTDGLSANKGKQLKDILDTKEFAKSFANIQAMVQDLNSAQNNSYRINFNLLIVALQVPDFWITEIMETSVSYIYTTDQALITAVQQAPVQIGYYKISLLESAKVDLTDYVQKTTTIAGIDLENDITASAMRIALNVEDGAEVNPTNYETTDTAQTISGIKTHSAEIILNNDVPLKSKKMIDGQEVVLIKYNANDDTILSNGTQSVSVSDLSKLIKTKEEYTILNSDWVQLSDQSPFTYQATMSTSVNINAQTVVELINNNGVIFANYGFIVGSTTSNSITFYSIGNPNLGFIVFTVEYENWGL